MKMQKLKFLGLASAIVLLSACGNSNHAAHEETHQAHQAHAGEAKVATISEANPKSDFSGISEEKGRQLLDKYLLIKDAHVASDGDKASELAKEMLLVFGSGGNGRNTKEMMFDVEQIAKTQDVEQQREHFKTLSDNMYKLAKTVKIKEGELFYQHCPMVFHNQGAYWLSAEKEIRNPYHGDKMLKCGSVKETL